ncbi:MAG: gamma-butyrobetaine hydroxylase-like domain-containing protein [Gammaproteobacteria bacterium]
MATPLELHLHQKTRLLDVLFDDGCHFSLACEYLRVYSPSAEVRGHGAGEGKLQSGKRYVNIISIEPVGNYAVKLTFDDGHSSGIYTWDWLYELGANQETYWQQYLTRLTAAGASREPSANP